MKLHTLNGSVYTTVKLVFRSAPAEVGLSTVKTARLWHWLPWQTPGCLAPEHASITRDCWPSPLWSLSCQGAELWAFVYALLTFRGLIRHCKWTVCVYLLKVIWARTASCQSRRPVFLAPGFGWKSWGLPYDSWEIAYQTWPGYNYTYVPPCREILIRWTTVDGKRVPSAMPQCPGFLEAAILKHKRWATVVFLNPL